MSFSVGDILVYPNYGIVEVKDKEKTEVGGHKIEVYVIQTQEKHTSIRVPVKNSEHTGLRRLHAPEHLDEIYAIVKAAGQQYDTPWVERIRINEARLKTGDLKEIAAVVRDLTFLKEYHQKNPKDDLFLKEAMKFLVSELAYIEKRKKQDIKDQLKVMMKHKAHEEGA